MSCTRTHLRRCWGIYVRWWCRQDRWIETSNPLDPGSRWYWRIPRARMVWTRIRTLKTWDGWNSTGPTIVQRSWERYSSLQNRCHLLHTQNLSRSPVGQESPASDASIKLSIVFISSIFSSLYRLIPEDFSADHMLMLIAFVDDCASF